MNPRAGGLTCDQNARAGFGINYTTTFTTKLNASFTTTPTASFKPDNRARGVPGLGGGKAVGTDTAGADL